MPEISSPPPPAIDPCLCPLCGQSNQCANEVERLTGHAQGPCWCTTTRFPADLLERIPDASRRMACVCARCAAEATLRQPVVQHSTPGDPHANLPH